MEKRIHIKGKELYLPMVVYLVATLLSCLFSKNFLESMKMFKDEWLILVFFLVVRFLKYERIPSFMNVLFIVMALSSIFGLVEIAIGRDLWRNRPIERADGFLGHYMTFSGQQMMTFCVLLGILIGNKFKSIKERLLYIFLILLISLGIIFSYTRGAWIGTVLSAILIVFFVGKQKLRSLIICAFGLFLILSIVVLNPYIKHRALSIFDAETWGGRHHMWIAATNMVLHRPLFGFGLGNYGAFAQRYIDVPLPEEINCHAHSLYFHILAERGIIGFLAFLFLICSIFKHGISVYKSNERLKGLVGGCLFSFVSFLIMGFFEYNFGDDEVIMLFWFLVAVVYIIGSRPKTGN